MKLVHPDYTYQMNFIEEKVNVAVIENVVEFRHLLEEILAQIDGKEGRFILSDNGEILKISNNVQCIIDPFSMELNSKKIIDKIYTLCKQEIMDSELFIQQEELFSNILLFAEKVMEKVDYSLFCSHEIDIKSLFKLVDMKFQNEQVDFLEGVVDYIKVNNTLLGNKIFIFVNLRSFLNRSELELLYKTARYEKIFLVFVEAHDFDEKSDYENKYIIDKDCCEIY